jgi:hypothetical protein
LPNTSRAVPKEITTPPLQEMNEFKATLNEFKGAQCPEADHRILAPIHHSNPEEGVMFVSCPTPYKGWGEEGKKGYSETKVSEES